MFPWKEFLPLLWSSFWASFCRPAFWIVLIIVGFMYRKMTQTTKDLFKTPGESPWRLTITAAFLGISGGFLGSCLLVLVGISLNEIGGFYLLITALALMLIQQRFLCFAYAGGVLSLISLLGGLQLVNVPQVMALVAILHLVEAFLIYFTGSMNVLPIYVSTKEGHLVGGYNLQKFWPLPLIVLFAGIYPDPQIIKGVVSMPDWWPLLKPEFALWQGDVVYSLLAIPAILGYGDVAISMTPREKTKLAGRELALYSIILLGLALGAGYYPPLAYLAALFGPGGHELVIYWGRRREVRGEPLFVPVDNGVKILAVERGGILANAGVKAGDVLLAINEQPLSCETEISAIDMEKGGKLKLKYLAEEQIKEMTLTIEKGMEWGFLPVPGRQIGPYLQVLTSVSPLKKFWVELQSFLAKWKN